MPDTILDGNAASYTDNTGASGGWTNDGIGVNNNAHYYSGASPSPGQSCTATWATTLSSAGSVKVGITWPPNVNFDASLSVKVFDSSTQLYSGTINETSTPSGYTSGGVTFSVLGTFTFATTSASVVLTGVYNETGYRLADAVVFSPQSSSSASITEQNLPSNHAGNITVHAVGTGTSWSSSTTWTASGVSGWSVASKTFVDATHYTIVLTPPGAATPPTGATGALTLTEGVTGTVAATTTVGTPSFTRSPTTGLTNTTPTVAFGGTNTLWSTETPAGLFTVSAGGTGASLATPTVASNTGASDVLTTGTSGGTLTLKDNSTGATVSFTVTAGTAYVSAANGDWSTPTSWTPNGVPSSVTSDTVTIHHNIAVTTNQSVGDGTAAACVTCPDGTLTITGATLTVHGSMDFGQAVNASVTRLKVQNNGTTPGQLLFNTAAATSPTITIRRDTHVSFVGTASALFVLNGQVGAGNPCHFVSDANGDQEIPCDFTYGTVSYIGDASHVGIACTLYIGVDLSSTFANLTLDHCGTFPSILVGNNAAVASITHCVYTNTLAAQVLLITSIGNTTGTRLVSDCQFPGTAARPYFANTQDFTIVNNYFDDWADGNDDSPLWVSFSNNFVRKQATNEALLNGALSDSFFLLDYSSLQGVGHCNRSGDHTHNGNVIQTSGTHQDMGCFEATEGGTANRTITVTHNILLPNANGLAPGQIATGFNNSGVGFNPTLVCQHNTMQGGAPDGVAYSSCVGTERADMITSFQSNLIWQAGTPASPSYVLTDQGDFAGGGRVVDGLHAANCTNNAYCGWTGTPAGQWTTTTPVSGATTCTDGTPYNAPMSGSSAPGANDVNLGSSVADVTAHGPKFVDPTRNLEAWAVHKGFSVSGDSAATKRANAMAQIQGNSALTTDLITWIKAGFVPQNSALHNTAHDGTDIGAMPYSSPVTHFFTLIGCGA